MAPAALHSRLMGSRYKGLAQELADLVTPFVDSPQWLSYGENRRAPLQVQKTIPPQSHVAAG